MPLWPAFPGVEQYPQALAAFRAAVDVSNKPTIESKSSQLSLNSSLFSHYSSSIIAVDSHNYIYLSCMHNVIIL